MEATDQATFSWTDDGLWLRGEFRQDQFADGRLVLTWSAHYLVGWDPQARDYVAFMADNCGHAGFMHGDIEGDRMILTTPGDDLMVLRITWDLASPGEPTWKDEVSVGGGPWQLIEQYTMVPTRSPGQAPSGQEHALAAAGAAVKGLLQ
jgi:hypothetical protein